MRAPEAPDIIRGQLDPRGQQTLASTNRSGRDAARPVPTMLWQDEAEGRMHGIDWDTYLGPVGRLSMDEFTADDLSRRAVLITRYPRFI
jgi:hypothetical protein